jgi:sugar lactone lactonase YvrE
VRRVIQFVYVVVAAACGAPPAPPVCKRVCTPPSWTTLSVLAGRPGGPGAVDAAGAAAHFVAPWQGALDGAGHLYLADGNMIRTIDLATAAVTTLAGTMDVNNGSYDGVGANASFNTPSGVAAFGGQVYVTDTENHTLRRIDVATATVTTIAGAFGMGSSVDDVGTAARFKEPEGLAIDATGTHLYIADTDNQTIRRVDLPSVTVTTLAGTPLMRGTTDATGAAARFDLPKALAVDAAGANLYIVDSNNRSIRKLALADNSVTTVVTMTTLPIAVAVNGAELLVSTDNRVVRIDIATGAESPLAGDPQQGFVDGAAGAARFFAPAGLIADGAGTLYVADTDNFAVRTVALATAQVATLAGSTPIGTADGIGGAARFNGVTGLAADATTLYVADTNNQLIRKVALATGEVSTLAGAAGQTGNADGADARFSYPSGLALDVDGTRLYVADRDNHQIRRVDVATGVVSTLALNPVGPGLTFLSSPEGLALDGPTLYVTDSGNHVVVAVTAASGDASLVAGTAGMAGRVDAIGTKARFYGPTGIAADGAGNLFIMDVVNNAVRKIVIATGAVTTLAGGTLGPDDGTGTAAHFYFPTQAVVDGVGELFIADSLNHTIRRLVTASAAVTTVIGNPRRFGVWPGPLPAQLGVPTALALTDDGALVLASESAILVAR